MSALPPGIWTCQTSFATDMGVAHALIQEVLEALRHRAWPSSELFGVEMALEEAFANAVHHGNRNDKTKKVYFSCEISEGSFHASVEDEGWGFNPDTLRDPRTPENVEQISGRGILLIRSFMDCIDYSNHGRRVAMQKSRKQDIPNDR